MIWLFGLVTVVSGALLMGIFLMIGLGNAGLLDKKLLEQWERRRQWRENRPK